MKGIIERVLESIKIQFLPDIKLLLPTIPYHSSFLFLLSGTIICGFPSFLRHKIYDFIVGNP